MRDSEYASREIVYNRFVDGLIGGIAFFGETAQRNEKRENFFQSFKYYSSRGILAACIYPYIGLCKLVGFDSSKD